MAGCDVRIDDIAQNVADGVDQRHIARIRRSPEAVLQTTDRLSDRGRVFGQSKSQLHVPADVPVVPRRVVVQLQEGGKLSVDFEVEQDEHHCAEKQIE